MAGSPEQVADGIHRVADGVVNFYLVTDDADGLAVVDAGWPRSLDAIHSAIAAIGRTPGDLDAILITHGHPDHVGVAEALRRETGASVFAHSREVKRVRGKGPGSSPVRLVPALMTQVWRPTAAAFIGEATVKGFLTPTWVEEVQEFEIGEQLDVPGKPTVISTAGHTPGHVSFHFESSGAMISGDAICTRDPVTGRTGPRLAHDVVNEDPDMTRRSLDELGSVGADVLLPGHGDPWRGAMADAAAEAREHAAA